MLAIEKVLLQREKEPVKKRERGVDDQRKVPMGNLDVATKNQWNTAASDSNSQSRRREISRF